MFQLVNLGGDFMVILDLQEKRNDKNIKDGRGLMCPQKLDGLIYSSMMTMMDNNFLC